MSDSEKGELCANAKTWAIISMHPLSPPKLTLVFVLVQEQVVKIRNCYWHFIAKQRTKRSGKSILETNNNTFCFSQKNRCRVAKKKHNDIKQPNNVSNVHKIWTSADFVSDVTCVRRWIVAIWPLPVLN